MIIVKIAITWLILDAIVCASWALIRANQRAGQREAREFSDAIELGGAATIIPFHDVEITDASA